ncbi:DUF3791 domain-containing protein [Eggerthellaceae bacterium 24-137]
MSERTRDEIAFSVYLLHALAAAWHKSVPDTFRLLQESEIMRDYIIPCYDALHCLGEEYLVDDITGFAREKGYAV